MAFTCLVETLCSRGHGLEDVLDKYSLSQVKNLARAAQINKTTSLIQATISYHVALQQALDSLSGSKKRPLKGWLDKMNKALREIEGATSPPQKKKVISEQAWAFFLSKLPIVDIRGKMP